MGSLSSFPKSPKISSNTYRTKLKLYELNSVSDTLQFEYKFGWCLAFFCKKTVSLKYSPFPYGIWAENKKSKSHNAKKIEGRIFGRKKRFSHLKNKD